MSDDSSGITSVVEGLEQATADLAAKMSGRGAPPANADPTPASDAPPTDAPPTPEPAPAPSPTEPEPEPAPAAEPTPTPTPEEPPSGAPGEETPPAPTVPDPAAQRFLDMHDGDQEKALAAALAYNNRLAALAKAHPELFAEGAPGDPNAPPPEVPVPFQDPAATPPPPTEPVPEVPMELGDEVMQKVAEDTAGWVRQDQECTRLVREFMGNQDRIANNEKTIEELQGNISYLQRKKSDPDFAEDDIRSAEIDSAIRDARHEASLLQIETSQLKTTNQNLDNDFRGRRSQAWDYFESQHREQVEEESAKDPDLFVFTNLAGTGNMEVNVFQRGCDVVIQKSLREGFGLVVSEALWKEKPVVAGKAGGIPMQFPEPFGKYLIDSAEQCAERVIHLLEHVGERGEFGRSGREHVRRHFLLPRLLRDELRFIAQIVGSR